MPIPGKIVDFFLDKTKSIVGFPRTKIKAVSDDNNVSLDVLLDNINTSIDNAQSIADNAKSTADSAKNAVDNAMPKSGGTFTGAVLADSGIRAGDYLRNINVKTSDASADVSTMTVYFTRK